MSEPISWASIFSITATLFGILASALMGMAVARLRGIENHLAQMNGKLFTHLTSEGNHGAGFARVDEQLRSLVQTVRVAHERIDRMKEAGASHE